MEEAKKIRLFERVQELKRLRNAVILAHNYQLEEVQTVADFVGDSFELSRLAAQSSAEVIVFCGVYFMAEVAAVLAPGRIVLLPVIQAGCPLADTITLEALREKKRQYPRAMVVTYINSPAVVKAESDICVTSSNAVSVVNSLETEEVLFVPDMNLGSFVAERTDKRVILWNGYCPTHHRVGADDVAAARRLHPDAVIVVHPECRPEVVKAADYVFSTGGISRFARETGYKKIIVGTEIGLVSRLQKENPDKQFFLLAEKLVCPNMKLTTLDKVCRALETLQPQVTVPRPLCDQVRRPLERMLTAAQKQRGKTAGGSFPQLRMQVR